MILMVFNVLYSFSRYLWTKCSKRLTISHDEAQETRRCPRKEPFGMHESTLYDNVRETSSYKLISGKLTRKKIREIMLQQYYEAPPAEWLRYYAVTSEIERYNGTVRKIADFGCGEMGYLCMMKNIRGIEEIICVDINKEILSRNVDVGSPRFINNFARVPQTRLIIDICVGNVIDNDIRLKNTDAVVCLELIEYMNLKDLPKLCYNIFAYIKPQVAIITISNADYKMANFPTSYPDKKFEWTKKQFHTWGQSIVMKYQAYSVEFNEIRHEPCLYGLRKDEPVTYTQVAVFHHNFDKLEQECVYIPGQKNLFRTVRKFDHPAYHVFYNKVTVQNDEEEEVEKEEKKEKEEENWKWEKEEAEEENEDEWKVSDTNHLQILAQECIEAYLFRCNHLVLNEVALSTEVLPFVRKNGYCVTTNALASLLIESGINVEHRENGPTVVISPGKYDRYYLCAKHRKEYMKCSCVVPEIYEIDKSKCSKCQEEVLLSTINETTIKESDHMSPSSVPQNHSVVQKNIFLPYRDASSIGDNVVSEIMHKNDHLTVNDTTGGTKNGLLSNSIPLLLNNQELSKTEIIQSNGTTIMLSAVPNTSLASKNAVDLVTIEPALSEEDVLNLKRMQKAASTLNCQPNLCVSRASTSPEPLYVSFELNNSLQNFSMNQNESQNEFLLNNTFRQLELDEAVENVEFVTESNVYPQQEASALENKIVACNEDSTVHSASISRNEQNIMKESTSREYTNMSNTKLIDSEIKASSPLGTPSNSWSPEIMDSGYPNTASAPDITPEYDLSSIAQDYISDSESPSIAEAPRFGILEPIEVENGDLANNNRDDEGNNMMAVDANDAEDLHLDIANPFEFDMQDQQNPRAVDEAADVNMGPDEGFDDSSSESDIVSNEMEKR